MPRLNRQSGNEKQQDSQSQGSSSVSGTPKSLPGRSESTGTTGQKPETTGTSPSSTLGSSPGSTSSSGDSLARLSALLDVVLDLTTPEGLSFLSSHGFLPTKNPGTLFSKTYGVYLVTTLDGLSRQSLGFLPTWGTTWNGRWLTAKITEFRRTGNASSLLDILEENPADRYYLSELQVTRLQQSGSRQKPQLLVHSPQGETRRVDIRQ